MKADAQLNNRQSISRRSMLKSLGAGAALGLTAANHRALAAASPNEAIHVGFIGVGGMGTGRLREFLRYDDVYAAAICDVDANNLNRARDIVEERGGHRPPGFQDYRNMLEMNELDAVMIASPDHWHALHFIDSCDAGLDAFVEKPLCHSINEGRAMVEAAARNQRVSQMGNHIHSGSNYRRVVEMVESGNLGHITKVHCWKSTSMRNVGFPDPQDAPKDLNYDLWLGPAPKVDYNPNRSHFNFRYFWDYSGGDFLDFWCHITDVAFWALKPERALTVSATGGRWYLDDEAETPDSMELIYAFPNLILNWTLHPHGLAGFEKYGGIGCIFQGSEATLVTNYDSNWVLVKGEEVEDFPRPEPYIPNSPGHVREFLDSVKTREQPSCNVEYAHYMTKPGLLGNIAYRTAATLHWDDEKEQVVGNHRANTLVNRNYRRPWRLG